MSKCRRGKETCDLPVSLSESSHCRKTGVSERVLGTDLSVDVLRVREGGGPRRIERC